MVPIAAGVGYIGASIHIFGFGAFIKPISAELGFLFAVLRVQGWVH